MEENIVSILKTNKFHNKNYKNCFKKIQLLFKKCYEKDNFLLIKILNLKLHICIKIYSLDYA